MAQIRPIRTGLTLYRLPTLVGDMLDSWLAIARQADAAEIDQISVPDHVILLCGGETCVAWRISPGKDSNLYANS